MISTARRILALRLSKTERVVGATTLAGAIIFVGLVLDMPTVRRAKALEAERHALNSEVAGLTVQLDQLAVQRRDAEAEAVRLESAPPDPRVSALMRELTAIENRQEVQFVSFRPTAASGEGTAVVVEVNAPLRVLGAYLDGLEESRWALRIRDLQLGRNPERVPSVTARFIVETAVAVQGLGPTSAAPAAAEGDDVP